MEDHKLFNGGLEDSVRPIGSMLSIVDDYRDYPQDVLITKAYRSL